MKINQIILKEMATTAGAVATVAKPMGETQKRPKIAGLKPAEKVMSGSTKKKGPYANSLNEGAVKQLSLDLKGGPDGLSDQEFQKKYKMSKQEARKEMAASRKQSKPEPVQEARLEEDDIIQMPGRGSKRKTGFVPRGQSRVDHEVEMARSDVLATMKNAKAIYQLLQNRGEDEGLEGWVQEKLIKANDYLNAIKEYYDEKMMEQGVAEGLESGAKILYTGKDKGGTVTISYEPDYIPGHSEKYIIRFDGKVKSEMPTLKSAVYGLTHYQFDTFRPNLQPNPKTALEQGVAEAEIDRPGMKDGRPYSDPYRRHPGNSSYMTPEYLIQKYKERLEQIAAGPYKRPKEVAQLQSRIAKLEKQGVAEGRATYGPITDAHKAASKKVFAAGVKDGKAGAEKNKQHMTSALMKTTYLNGYKQGAAEGKVK